MNDKIKELEKEIELVKNLSSGNDPKIAKIIKKLQDKINKIKNNK